MKTKYIPREKMNKKQRKRQDNEQRAVWTISPITRSAPNPRIYNRKKHRIEKDDFRFGAFYSLCQCPLSPLVDSGKPL